MPSSPTCRTKSSPRARRRSRRSWGNRPRSPTGRTAKPPEGADAKAVAAYEAEALDEIWIYANGRVHFTLAGTAAKVDDKVDRDLPPPEGTMYV